MGATAKEIPRQTPLLNPPTDINARSPILCGSTQQLVRGKHMTGCCPAWAAGCKNEYRFISWREGPVALADAAAETAAAAGTAAADAGHPPNRPAEACAEYEQPVPPGLAEPPPGEGEEEEPTSEEARQQARAEGLTMQVAKKSETGFLGVHHHPGRSKPYEAGRAFAGKREKSRIGLWPFAQGGGVPF